MQAIYNHQFLVELIDGTLQPEKFIFYVQQDRLYLDSYSRALAITGAKMTVEEDRAFLLHCSLQGLEAEHELHTHYFKELLAPNAERKAPTCHAYCAHILERAALGSGALGLAALLPSFWIYREVGRHLRAEVHHDNPYFRWIESYSDEEYSLQVDTVAEMADRLASDAGEEESRRMFEAFVISSRYEYCFWDDAYNLRDWPI